MTTRGTQAPAPSFLVLEVMLSNQIPHLSDNRTWKSRLQLFSRNDLVALRTGTRLPVMPSFELDYRVAGDAVDTSCRLVVAGAE